MVLSDPGLVLASSIKDVVFAKTAGSLLPMTETFGSTENRGGAARHTPAYCSSSKNNSALPSILELILSSCVSLSKVF